MLVFSGKLSPSTLKWVPICQGFSKFSGFSHHFVLAKLATSSIRVNTAGLLGKGTSIISIILSFDIAPFPYKHAQRIYDTFANNLGIKKYVTKYSKEIELLVVSWLIFLLWTFLLSLYLENSANLSCLFNRLRSLFIHCFLFFEGF